jgi:hypothetical protein
MKQTFLDFEQPIAELQSKIDELRYVHEDSAVDISDEITRLSKKSQQLTKEVAVRRCRGCREGAWRPQYDAGLQRLAEEFGHRRRRSDPGRPAEEPAGHRRGAEIIRIEVGVRP